MDPITIGLGIVALIAWRKSQRGDTVAAAPTDPTSSAGPGPLDSMLDPSGPQFSNPLGGSETVLASYGDKIQAAGATPPPSNDQTLLAGGLTTTQNGAQAEKGMEAYMGSSIGDVSVAQGVVAQSFNKDAQAEIATYTAQFEARMAYDAKDAVAADSRAQKRAESKDAEQTQRFVSNIIGKGR